MQAPIAAAGMPPDADSVEPFDFVLRPVEEISAIARSLKCVIVVRKPGDRRNTIVEVQESSYERLAGSLLIAGDTTIQGEIKGVGGATGMRCRLRVSFQPKLLFCDVASQEVSRKLGQHLYEEVAAKGTAKWIQRSWRIFSFRITDIYQPRMRLARKRDKTRLNSSAVRLTSSRSSPRKTITSLFPLSPFQSFWPASTPHAGARVI
jgi:hypothetical protein